MVAINNLAIVIISIFSAWISSLGPKVVGRGSCQIYDQARTWKKESKLFWNPTFFPPHCYDIRVRLTDGPARIFLVIPLLLALLCQAVKHPEARINRRCERESPHSGDRKKDRKKDSKKKRKKPTEKTLHWGWNSNPRTLSPEPSALTTKLWHPWNPTWKAGEGTRQFHFFTFISQATKTRLNFADHD